MLDQATPKTIDPVRNGPEVVDTPIVDAEQEAPEKVHIRGVDDLTTEDIMTFTAEHFPSVAPIRIEWIDDTSANIVFETTFSATDALQSFTHPSVNGTLYRLQLRAAKQLSTHPDSSLQVRIALFTDQKRPRAYEASRFYMMHPELDPREQGHRDKSNRPGGNGDYRRRQYSQKEHRRRLEGDKDGAFDSAMYDDNPEASRRSNSVLNRRASRSSFSSSHELNTTEGGINHRGRLLDSYRPGISSSMGRAARDRSASPGGSGRLGRHNFRGRTPPPPYQSRDPFPVPTENLGKELFPSKAAPRSDLTQNGTDLFPKKTPVAGAKKKELFPHKTPTSNHRRSDAFDAADKTTSSRFSPIPLSERITKPHTNLKGKLTKPSFTTTISYGRLTSDPEQEQQPEPMALEVLDDGGLNIRGISSQIRESGFHIRGAAETGAMTVRELFPAKAMGNSGKELFAEKLQGRGGKRNRAEDMFY